MMQADTAKIFDNNSMTLGFFPSNESEMLLVIEESLTLNFQVCLIVV